MTPQEFQRITALGDTLTPEVFRDTHALFAPLALKPDLARCRVERDVSYGPDPRNRLDIFTPADGADGRAVLLFVHGGGFMRGDKGGPDDPFYNNLGAWAVSNGLIGVTMTYRLAPAATWPAGAQDVEAALVWLRSNIAVRGGSPDQIVLMGQSAGAVHVANFLAGHHGLSVETLPAAAVMVSGLYDMTRLDYSPFEHAYFGKDPAHAAAHSSLDGLTQLATPLLFAVAEHDPGNFQQQAKFVTDAFWAAQGRLPRMLYLGGHNHLSPLYRIGLESDDFGPQLLTFITHRAGSKPAAAAGSHRS